MDSESVCLTTELLTAAAVTR